MRTLHTLSQANGLKKTSFDVHDVFIGLNTGFINQIAKSKKAGTFPAFITI